MFIIGYIVIIDIWRCNPISFKHSLLLVDPHTNQIEGSPWQNKPLKTHPPHMWKVGEWVGEATSIATIPPMLSTKGGNNFTVCITHEKGTTKTLVFCALSNNNNIRVIYVQHYEHSWTQWTMVCHAHMLREHDSFKNNTCLILRYCLPYFISTNDNATNFQLHWLCSILYLAFDMGLCYLTFMGRSRCKYKQ